MALLSTALDRNVLLSRFDDSKRLVAKLMARENISVQIIDGQPTASFDVLTRVLTLPNWPFISVDQFDTQLCHEIGHALWTDTTYLEKLAKRRNEKISNSGLFTYINVIEDTRIERKMREAYPGVTRVFYNGRKAFAENGPIFQVADAKRVLIDGVKVKVASMKFIDRVNLFYKIGAFIDVPFSADERKWLAIIDKCYSTENACDIAEQLHKLAKEKAQEQKRENAKKEKQKGQKSNQSQQGSGDEGDDDDSEGDESGEESGKSKSKSKKDKKDDKKDAKKSTGAGDEGDEDSDEDGDGSSDGDEDDDEEGSGSGTGDEDEDEDGDEDGKGKGSDDGGDEDDDAEGDEDGDSTSAPLGSGGDSSKADEKDPSSDTDKALAKALEALAESQPKGADQIRNLLIRPLDEKVVKSRTVTAAEWVAMTEKHLAARGVSATALDRIEHTWAENYMPTVRHMVAEFTRKRTAKNLMHARTGKTGRLNMNKLASYQLTDDLFKQVTTVPNGQSHGIVAIIDGSSSMNSVFGDVVDQTLLFAHFAFLVNVPFEAYMFTDRSSGYGGSSFTSVKEPVQTIGLPNSGKLVGLINTATDRRGFKRQVKAVLALRGAFSQDKVTLAGGRAEFDGVPYSDLGSTPLYAGMMLMERHVERMKRTMRLDKVMGIVITDGEDTAKLSFTGNSADYNGRMTQKSENLVRQPVVVRDTKTKKNHLLVASSQYGGYSQPENGVITLLFDVMKERHDCRGIMLYLVPSSQQAERAVRKMQRNTEGATKPLDSTAITTQMSRTNQAVLPVGGGVADCCIVVNTNALALQENTFAGLNLTGKTATAITNAFVAELLEARASRVFVNTIVPFLA
jgi:hypothetical protein